MCNDHTFEYATRRAPPTPSPVREEDGIPPRRSDWVSALRGFLLTWEKKCDRPLVGTAHAAKKHAKEWADRLAEHPYPATPLHEAKDALASCGNEARDFARPAHEHHECNERFGRIFATAKDALERLSHPPSRAPEQEEGDG